MIQESLLLAPCKLFPRFVSFDVPAVVTGGQNSGGLCVLVKRLSFGGATFEVLLQETSTLAVLLRSSSSSLLITVYAPNGTAHMDFYMQAYARFQALL
jgi:hypothetical protein